MLPHICTPYLTHLQGYCNGGDCKLFPVLLGETGSYLSDPAIADQCPGFAGSVAQCISNDLQVILSAVGPPSCSCYIALRVYAKAHCSLRWTRQAMLRYADSSMGWPFCALWQCFCWRAAEGMHA